MMTIRCSRLVRFGLSGRARWFSSLGLGRLLLSRMHFDEERLVRMSVGVWKQS